MQEALRKTSAKVKCVHLAHIYIEQQWKSSKVKSKRKLQGSGMKNCMV